MVMETMAFGFAVYVSSLCVFCLVFSLSHRLCVHTKKPHHRVDRLIFRCNSPFLFSFIFQRVHSLAFDIQRVLFSTNLHEIRDESWMHTVISV